MDSAPPDSPRAPSASPPRAPFDIDAFLRESVPDAPLPAAEIGPPAPPMPAGPPLGRPQSKEALRKKRWRKTLSPGRRERIKEREREQKRRRFRSLSDEGRAQHRQRDRIRKARERDAETPAQREERLARERERKQALRALRGAHRPPVAVQVPGGRGSSPMPQENISPATRLHTPPLLPPTHAEPPEPPVSVPVSEDAQPESVVGADAAADIGHSTDRQSGLGSDALLEDPFGLGDPLAEWGDGSCVLDGADGDEFLQNLFDSGDYFNDLL